MKRILSLVLISLMTTPSWSSEPQTFDGSQSCVVYYLRNSQAVPNLVTSCDGKVIEAKTVPVETQLESPASFKAKVKMDFFGRARGEGKFCHEWEQATLWWSSCY